MAQVIVRNLSERAVKAFRDRARASGTSLEHELRQLIEAHAPLDPFERTRIALAIRNGFAGPLPPLPESEPPA